MRDRFTLYARGGEGGNGCSSLRRSRTDRFGKPDGTETYLKSDNNMFHFGAVQLKKIFLKNI